MIGPRAIIDLSALRHNLACARRAAPGARVMAVIKSNGYGHGMLRVARALEEADAFAVARVAEGVQLRRAGIDKRVVVLEGGFDPGDLEAAAALDLELTIHHAGQLDLLAAFNRPDALICWLKVDTGMHRLGVAREHAVEFWRCLLGTPCVGAVAGLMTHLANADDLSDDTTREQLKRFLPLARELGIPSSICNSAGVLGWPEAHGDWIRPGIMLYGASPLVNGDANGEGLRPVMHLETTLIAVNHCRAGDPVGYGGTWRCPEAMPLGVAAVGYGDGYPRHLPSGTPVLLNGQRVPLVGRVSMDMITLDLRSQPQAGPGDPVRLWGERLPVDEIAARAGTIAYELTCGVTQRVEFVEVEGGRDG
ncbi:MAG: alanine racemase [gamma proteobacterium symbiont of Phacoides pectinatus]